MKTIQPVTIWANGETKEATILNAYAVSVVLDSNATFYYWEQDETAWEWIADTLNLTITGDYVKTEE